MDPVALNIGPLEIRWYGIMMAASMLLGAWIGARLLKKAGYDGELVWDGLVWIILFGIIGARLIYVLTSLSDFIGADPWWEFLAIWHGGLSFHGGIIGGGLATYFYFRKHGIPFLTVADSFVPGVCLGIVLVRMGNFMNGDILGYKWDGPWAMNFPYDQYHLIAGNTAVIPRHPTELYGLLVGVICLAIALVIWRKTYISHKLLVGATFMSFLITYSLVRGLLEDPFRDVPLFWKLTDPTTQGIGILTMSQLISVPIILIGVWGLMQLRRWQPAEGTAAASTQSGLTRQQRRARDRSGKT